LIFHFDPFVDCLAGQVRRHAHQLRLLALKVVVPLLARALDQ
jgi:hypothetical protein